MKKEALLRALRGFPMGIALGYAITILIGVMIGGGAYTPCMPQFVDAVGSEIGAVIIQALLCGVMGAGFAATSVIWEIEHWSIAKQSGICFAIYAIVMLPIAYITNWMPHNLVGFLLYFGIFAAIFVIIWVVQYLLWKSKVDKLNSKLHKQ